MNAEWAEILDHIQGRIEQMRQTGNDLWFRGQSNASWPLTSSLHRNVSDSIERSHGQLRDENRRELLREQFKSFYHTFKADAWALLEPDARGEWSLVFHMQHHGIPTRLLDWSESFACALHFAQDGRREGDDAAIFILDPVALNVQSVGVNGNIAVDDDMLTEARAQLFMWHPKFVAPADDLPTIAVAPVLANTRMLAQRAAFTICGDSFESLDTIYDAAIEKVILPASTFDAAEQFLELVGAGPYGYFPDLDGLQRKHKLREARRKSLLTKVTAPSGIPRPNSR